MPVLHSVFSLMLLMATSVQGDYPCICNYNIESSVYESTAKGAPIGYLYEFDCKPEGPPTNDPNWVIIQYEKKYGYIEKGQGVEAQTCPGAPPASDLVTTTTSSITTELSTSTTVATTTSTSTPAPTTTTTTPVPITSTTTITTTTPVPSTTTTTTTTTTPKPTTPTTTTHEPTTTTTTSTPAPTTTTTTTPVPTTTTTSTTTPTSKTTTTTYPKLTTTTTPIPVTTSTTTTITTPRPSTTQRPTQLSTSTPSSQGQYSCPQRYVQHAHSVLGSVFTIDSTCYELVPTDVTWEHAEADCVAREGHLAHIPDQRHQDIIYNMTMRHYGHDIWIGFHDRNQEQHYEWSSGDPVIYSNWQQGHETFAHNFEDCASLAANTLHGRWDDTTCIWLMGYLCEFNDAHGHTTPTAGFFTGVSGTDGDIHMCPLSVQSQARVFNYPLAQHGDSCYELQTDETVIWAHGESICKQSGGHLVSISSAAEQAFVEAFMSRHNPNHAVWIGLHDRNVEGNYEWTSGERLTYINWIPNHKDNFETSQTEDCIVLVPYKSGQWDDIPCGFQHSFVGDDMGAQYYSFCEYKTFSSPASLIG